MSVQNVYINQLSIIIFGTFINDKPVKVVLYFSPSRYNDLYTTDKYQLKNSWKIQKMENLLMFCEHHASRVISTDNNSDYGNKEIKITNFFFFCIYLLVMPKYWRKQIFTHGRFPEVGEKQKAQKERKKKERKKKVGENNGQLRFVRHHVWRTQARLDQYI